MTPTKLRLIRPAWAIGALALALTVPLDAGGRGSSPYASQSGQSVTPGKTQGRSTAPPTAQGEVQRSGGPRQGPSGPRQEWEWWNDASVKKELELSEGKAREIQRIYQDRLRQAKPFSDELSKQREELNRMASERIVDDATFGLQVARFEALLSELRKSRAIMIYRISRKLSADQLKKLKALQERHSPTGRGGGSAR